MLMLFFEYVGEVVFYRKTAFKRSGHQAPLLHNFFHPLKNEPKLFVHVHFYVQGNLGDTSAFFVV